VRIGPDKALTSAASLGSVPEPVPGAAGKPAAPAKPPAPRAVILGDAKVTIQAPIFRVFAALTTQEQLAAWWGQDALVEADVGGRYETTLPTGRVEGTIMAIDGPGTLAFAWPLRTGDATVSTSVHYELSPRGPQTAVHLAHRGLSAVPGDWNSVWRGVLESLKAYIEGAGTG
jgi:uncharacterized protein YndB with AHSA1/START domain